MNAFPKVYFSIVAVWLVALLSGCALPQRGAISGGVSDFSRYETSRTGILPIVLNPQYPVGGLQAKAIQRSVSKALNMSFSLRTQDIEPSATLSAHITFPLTPQRLRTLSDELGLDGVVGISVSSWSEADPRCSHATNCLASADLMISYAGRDPALAPWTVTGTWSATSAEKLDEEIKIGLPFLLTDLRYALSKSRLSAWFAEEWKDGPQLTYLVPQLETERGQHDFDGKFLDIHLTSIEDAGITSLAVTNEANGFAWTLDSAKSPDGTYPVYLASRVRVPLAYGTNDLVLKANSADMTHASSRRALRVKSTARHELFVVAVGVDEYPYLGPVRNAAQSAVQLAKEAGSHSGESFLPISNDQARSDTINELVSKATTKLFMGDTLVILFSGRVVPTGSAVFLALSDMEAEQPRPGSFLRVEDLIRGISSRERVLILDLCSDASQTPIVRRYLQSAIPTDQMAHVRLGSCDAPLGGLAQTAANLLQRKHRRTFSDYDGKSFFMDFEKAVAGGTGDLDGERIHLAFSGDGALITTSTVPPPTTQNEEQPVVVFNSSASGISSAKAEVSIDPAEFYVVTYSTSNLKEAIDKARQLNRDGLSVNVLQGKSGGYGVTIGHSNNVRGAYDQLLKAQRVGDAAMDAYVLPRSRINRIEF